MLRPGIRPEELLFAGSARALTAEEMAEFLGHMRLDEAAWLRRAAGIE